MVSKAHIQRKKEFKAHTQDHWLSHIGRAPEDDPFAGICDRCRGWTPSIITNCRYDMCQQTWCAKCGRAGTSFGPMGCPCDGATWGHNTRDEQPPARGKVVLIHIEKDGFMWPDFKVIPINKFKKRRRRGW